MEHTLIATIALSFLFAFVAGLLAVRIGLPPLVGYLLAGVAVGPHTPGFVADISLAQQLSEIGVILLMFGVGLHFSFRDLLKMRHIALPGAVLQILAATAMGAALAHWWGWDTPAAILFGLSLSVASTVVLLRGLEEHKVLNTVHGRIAVGWLVVEDLVMVLALVMLPALDALKGGDNLLSNSGFWLSLGLVLVKVSVFSAVMIVAGAKVVPWLLQLVVKTDSRELFTLAVIAVALGIAYAAATLFGVSFALGAFLAGVVINGSHISHRAAANALPFQDAFAVLFFVAVGMLFDPSVLLNSPWHVLAAVAIILIGKSLVAFVIVLAFKYPLVTALTVSAGLAQIGEFSFILASLGMLHGLLPVEGQNIILASALISITLNPLTFRSIKPILAVIEKNPRWAARFNRNQDKLAAPATELGQQHMHDHVVLIGFGRVGRRIGAQLDAMQLPYLVIEHDRHFVETLRKRQLPVIYGDASLPGILEHAELSQARILVITTPERFQTRRVIELARQLNPDIDIIVRTHHDDEYQHLKDMGIDSVVMGERELAQRMGEEIGRRLHVLPTASAEQMSESA
ncbi:cation:proton antiporter domain-containing protein [Permianibacter fluminis]|uniref:cation:proton antiporter domain-containing protein n=1 Tax=Permianibacter fluminis TaxID=2738515 RepID=UPI002E2CE96C|nr:cation:proton antiporter [Permianibacter fluminis]